MRPPRFLPAGHGGGAHARRWHHPTRSMFDTRCHRASRVRRRSPPLAQRRRLSAGGRCPAGRRVDRDLSARTAGGGRTMTALAAYKGYRAPAASGSTGPSACQRRQPCSRRLGVSGALLAAVVAPVEGWRGERWRVEFLAAVIVGALVAGGAVARTRISRPWCARWPGSRICWGEKRSGLVDEGCASAMAVGSPSGKAPGGVTWSHRRSSTGRECSRRIVVLPITACSIASRARLVSAGAPAPAVPPVPSPSGVS